jgi:hypothetical protein
MIAPIRTSPNAAESTSTGPQHVGNLLPLVLARYGIVLTAAELAALRPAASEKTTARQPPKLPLRGAHRTSRKQILATHCKQVQLPLFPSNTRTTTHSIAVR